MIAALLLAACVPDPGYSGIPSIQWDHDRINTTLYRVYVQRSGDTTWPWHRDLTYWPGDEASASFAPGVDAPWPLMRAVPDSEQGQTVRVMVKAVSPTNVESAPSNVLEVCMETWRTFP